jgi:hypothetical protein
VQYRLPLVNPCARDIPPDISVKEARPDFPPQHVNDDGLAIIRLLFIGIQPIH